MRSLWAPGSSSGFPGRADHPGYGVRHAHVAAAVPATTVTRNRDGIINALTLASATVLHGHGLTISLALRVAAVALISSIFTVFVAEYGQLRANLARAERELSFTVSGRLAASNLGRQVAREAAAASAVASGASFVGAVTPLLIGAALTAYSWSALIVSVAALGALGAVLAAAVGGRRLWWIIAMIAMGLLAAAAGTALNIT